MAGLFTKLGFDGLDALEVGVVRTIAAVQEAAAIGAKQGGELMADKWRQNVEDILIHGYATDNYYDSITVGEPTVKGTDVEVEVYTDAENENTGEVYPEDLEYGWLAVPEGYPTMTPAFEETKDEAIAAVAETEAAALNTWFP